ncbi:MAG: VanZ family protein, partial [Gemmatimonadales bacterium]
MRLRMPRVQQSESDSRRLLLAATLGILLLTLTPISNPAEALSTFCILCGSYGTADFLLNVLMFAPPGYLICRVINYRSRALLVVVTATVAIELAQVLIPGRFPTLGDVVANIIGGSLGIWAVHVRAHQPDRSPHRGAQAAARTAPFALTAALILTGILLLRP